MNDDAPGPHPSNTVGYLTCNPPPYTKTQWKEVSADFKSDEKAGILLQNQVCWFGTLCETERKSILTDCLKWVSRRYERDHVSYVPNQLMVIDEDGNSWTWVSEITQTVKTSWKSQNGKATVVKSEGERQLRLTGVFSITDLKRLLLWATTD